MKKKDREHVLYIIMEVLEENKYSGTVLHQVFDSFQIDERERSFIKKLSFGVIERAIWLDAVIGRFSKIKTEKMKPLIRNILRMGVYELIYMEQVPASATCNEAVNIVGKRGLGGLKGFVNGVLRNIERNKSDVIASVGHLSVSEQYSMPEWIVSLLEDQYDKKTTVKILSSFLEEKPVTIRVNLKKSGTEYCYHAIAALGYSVKPGAYMNEALRIQGTGNVESLPGFADGNFIVQDESSMLPAKCAGIREGMRVMDICAAPGGKTLQAAEYAGESGIVYARDITEYKCEKIRSNAKRLGFKNIDIKCNDARVPEEELFGRMDVVIADVPCSGIGIIGKKPDIKYNISERSVSELISLQRQIIDTAVNYVKPGGILMYSTCTINKKENEENVRYMKEHFPFDTVSMKEYLPGELREYEKDAGMLQILPGVVKSDGFFVAKLIRQDRKDDNQKRHALHVSYGSRAAEDES